MAITNVITLNQLIKWFQLFQQNNYFLNDFGFGEPYDISTSRQMNFPYMWVMMNDDSTIAQAGHNKTAIPELSFSIMFMDKINIQENYLDTNGFPSDNSQEILSDMLQVLQDLLTDIAQNWQTYGIFISQDVTFYPAVDETTDKATGIVARIILKLKYVNCIIPENPYFDTPTPTPAQVTSTPTPTATPTPTPTPSPVTVYQYFTANVTGATSQQINIQCWDTFWNIGPGPNQCAWTGEIFVTGSTGTVVNPTFTYPLGQQTYVLDLSSSLGVGQTIANISCCWNVSIPCQNYIPNFI
jgi:hypothetical protein